MEVKVTVLMTLWHCDIVGGGEGDSADDIVGGGEGDSADDSDSHTDGGGAQFHQQT